jgi:F-type H+-transporting ATPase subunit b
MDSLAALGINGPLLIAFVVNFFILFGILFIFLYKPVLKMLDERQAKIKASMDQAEQIKLQAASNEETIKNQLAEARKEAQQIIAQATQIGERIKNEAKDVARTEAESLIEKAKVEIKHQRDKDVEQLKTQFADIAILAAQKVIQETLDKQKHHKVIDEVLNQAKDLKKG